MILHFSVQDDFIPIKYSVAIHTIIHIKRQGYDARMPFKKKAGPALALLSYIIRNIFKKVVLGKFKQNNTFEGGLRPRHLFSSTQSVKTFPADIIT
ncbi:MAG: hypothetical protein PHQ97_07200 [Desulfobacterales bacterium]|nr:hypothetical protein [Desulfobacterales bacterium]